MAKIYRWVFVVGACIFLPSSLTNQDLQALTIPSNVNHSLTLSPWSQQIVEETRQLVAGLFFSGKQVEVIIEPYLREVMEQVKEPTEEQLQAVETAIKEIASSYRQTLRASMGPEQQILLSKAFALSLILHAGQPRARGDYRPYSIHVSGVVQLILGEFRLLEQVTYAEGIIDILAAVWLHDVIDDARKGKRGGMRWEELNKDEKGLREEISDLIQQVTNSDVLQLVRNLSKPEPDALSDEELSKFGMTRKDLEDKGKKDKLEDEIEKQHYLGLAEKHLGTQLIKAADLAFNLRDLINHPDRSFPRKFFRKRLGPVLGFLKKAKLSSYAKGCLVELIEASVRENNQANTRGNDPEKAPPVLDKQQILMLIHARGVYLQAGQMTPAGQEVNQQQVQVLSAI